MPKQDTIIRLAIAWNNAKTIADKYSGDSIAEFMKLSKISDEAQRKLRRAINRLKKETLSK